MWLLVLPVFGLKASPQFEVATLKLSPPQAAASIGVNLGTFQKGRFTFGNVTLSDAILSAFDLPPKELLVGLDWSDSVRFDVEGLAPPETPQPQLRLMVRRLLERLHLVVRREQRTIRHLALVVGPRRPQVQGCRRNARPDHPGAGPGQPQAHAGA